MSIFGGRSRIVGCLGPVRAERVAALGVSETLVAVPRLACIRAHLQAVVADNFDYIAEDLKNGEGPAGNGIGGDLVVVLASRGRSELDVRQDEDRKSTRLNSSHANIS